MKLNYYLPQYHFVEKHSIIINSIPEKVFKAIWHLDIADSKIVRILFKLRGFYGLIHTGGKSNQQSSLGLSFGDLINNGGFILLEEDPNQEIVMGMAGKFWQPSGGKAKNMKAEDFASFEQTGYCKTAWNFYINKTTSNALTLSTETRVLCYGKQAKLFFLFYWSVIRLFSGWIRLEMLKMIKEQAEGNTTY